MNTSLDHLPQHKQEQLKQITEIIVKAADPEKVILFGSHATGRWVQERIADGTKMYEYVSDYDILVITKSGDRKKDYEVQDLIENRCIYKTPVLSSYFTHYPQLLEKASRLLKCTPLLKAAVELPLLYKISSTNKRCSCFNAEQTLMSKTGIS